MSDHHPNDPTQAYQSTEEMAAALVALRRILGHLKGAWSSIRAGWAWRASVKNMSVTDLHLASIFLGLGLFMSFSGATIYQHYLICTFPFAYIFIARILEGHRKLLGALMIAQLLITLGFLLHIHLHDGAPHGDYGRTFRAQIVSGL